MCPQETEKIIAELNETWEEKLRKTEALRMERCEGGADSWSPGRSEVGREGQALQGRGSWVPMTRPSLLCLQRSVAG